MTRCGSPAQPRLGAAMPVVLGILVLVGVLVSLQVVRERSAGAVVSAWQRADQPDWLALAGRALALEDLDGEGLLWTEGSEVEEWYQQGRRGARAKLLQTGFEVAVEAIPLGVADSQSRCYPLRFLSDGGDRALVLPSGGRIVLGGDSRILGRVDAPGAVFVASPWSILPAASTAGLKGVLDTSRGAGRGWRADTRRVEAWWDSLLEAASRTPGSPGESGDGRTMYRSDAVRIGKGDRMEGVTVVAPRILVSDGAELRDCVLLAADSLRVQGRVLIDGGQFLSGRAMSIDLERGVEGLPLFGILLDGEHEEGKGLGVESLSGEGDLVVVARKGVVVEAGAWIRVARGVKAGGLIYTTGGVDLSGVQWMGTVVAGTLVASRNGTTYGGALLDTRLTPPPTPRASPLLWNEPPHGEIVSWSARGCRS